MIISKKMIDASLISIKDRMDDITGWKLYKDYNHYTSSSYQIYAVASTADGNILGLVWEKTERGYNLTPIQALLNATSAGKYGHFVTVKTNNIAEAVMRFNSLNPSLSPIRYAITKDGSYFVSYY